MYQLNFHCIKYGLVCAANKYPSITTSYLLCTTHSNIQTCINVYIVKTCNLWFFRFFFFNENLIPNYCFVRIKTWNVRQFDSYVFNSCPPLNVSSLNRICNTSYNVIQYIKNPNANQNLRVQLICCRLKKWIF